MEAIIFTDDFYSTLENDNFDPFYDLDDVEALGNVNQDEESNEGNQHSDGEGQSEGEEEQSKRKYSEDEEDSDYIVDELNDIDKVEVDMEDFHVDVNAEFMGNGNLGRHVVFDDHVDVGVEGPTQVTATLGPSQVGGGASKPKNVGGGVGRGRGNNAGAGKGRGNNAGGSACRENNAGVSRRNNASVGRGRGNKASGGAGRGKNAKVGAGRGKNAGVGAGRGTDKTKITRKPSKTGKHGHENERAQKKPGNQAKVKKSKLSNSSLSPGTEDAKEKDVILIGKVKQKITRGLERAQGMGEFALYLLSKEAQSRLTHGCH
ncbi:hypothetical protein Tco_1356062, partial [Tanacetum coccineum]